MGGIEGAEKKERASPVREAAVALAGANDAEGVNALAMPMTDMATAALTAALPIWRHAFRGRRQVLSSSSCFAQRGRQSVREGGK